MKAQLIKESIDAIEELYIVEERNHYISINNTPQFRIKCYIFTNKEEGKRKAVEIRSGFNNSKLSKARLGKIDAASFEWYTINKHKAFSNGVEHNFYNLRGDLLKIHPNTREGIHIDEIFHIEEGKKIFDYLHKWD
jgi:hypothetical protein